MFMFFIHLCLCVCETLHAQSAWLLLQSAATDASCHGAATWVSKLSHCGVTLFDDKRVLDTLSRFWGDQLLQRCSNTVVEAVTSWHFFFWLSFYLFLCLLPFFHLNGLTPLFRSLKWIDALVHCFQSLKRLRHVFVHAGVLPCLFFFNSDWIVSR